MTGGMVIVGAGECGARAALALREHGFAGPVTLIGAEAHLPYERPPLEQGDDVRRKAAEATFFADEQASSQRDLHVWHRRAVAAIDRGRKRCVLQDGASLAYEKLLLATGARPRRLVVEGRIGLVIFAPMMMRWLSAAALHRGHAGAGIGGGFFGLELAAAARCAERR